ncbi:5'-methylthioadenosine/S-adenosylhomocysteine nucleosidase [Glycomyces sp. NPDC049804]|uniref:5'-methylthioadenosine/S-adenosylhomocysteine nucleosidase family protein n=1 Tax=Glycomyces sp. NPDC049804 TaxID=3154363 RepID=UPI003447CD15
MTDPDIVVLTALDLEYEAVRQHLVDTEVRRHGAGTRFEVGTVRDSKCRIALGLTGVGNHAAAVLAERAVQAFTPKAVLFVGVAGALWDSISLGDVVVASRVYAYHGGTSNNDGLKARPRAWEAPHGISQLAHHLARNGDWAKRLPPETEPPKVLFGPIAAGEVVQNSRISVEAKWIREHYNDATAIEMEAAGVAQAGHLNNAPVAIVRGISDMANGSKNASRDGAWQPRAAANAAAFALRLAEEINIEAKETSMASDNPKPRSTGDTVINVASGQVGIQGGSVAGCTVWMSTAPTAGTGGDLASAVAALRRSITRHHADGTIDDDTYEAAQGELDTAETALREPGEQSTKKSVLALKRLRGLVADTADLAAKIAVVIAAVNGLS